MSTPRQNLEIKARIADLASARQRLAGLRVRDGGVELQTDTYFFVRRGRLKLREILGQPTVLIAYHRPDSAEARTSDYRLMEVAEAETLKAALADTLGVRVVVRKCRTVLLWENVRIHLDEVDGLGNFVEFEAVLSAEADLRRSQGRLYWLERLLEIRPEDHVAVSYADLLNR
jgi:predicted adenylyl cyclase CyaB